MKVEWEYNISFFTERTERPHNVVNVLRVLDKFCTEYDCTHTNLCTIICDEEMLVMFKLWYPSLVRRVYMK